MSYDWLRYIRDPNPWTRPNPLPGPIETERLIVRLYERGDGPRVHETVARERDSILPWMVWALVEHRSVDDSVHFVEQCRRNYAQPDNTEFFMGIWEKETGDYVGGSGFARIDAGVVEAEIGYWVCGSRQRRGYCTEATRALMSQAFTPQERGGWGFRRIVIQCAERNLASKGVCEKLGLRLELRARQAKYLGPAELGIGYHDVCAFAVLKDEWDVERHALSGR